MIATIPVGYADGYARGLSNKGAVLIHGRRAPILGRVCMDQFMVDVTDIPDVKNEDEVILIGRMVMSALPWKRSAGYPDVLIMNSPVILENVYHVFISMVDGSSVREIIFRNNRKEWNTPVKIGNTIRKARKWSGSIW